MRGAARLLDDELQRAVLEESIFTRNSSSDPRIGLLKAGDPGVGIIFSLPSDAGTYRKHVRVVERHGLVDVALVSWISNSVVDRFGVSVGL